MAKRLMFLAVFMVAILTLGAACKPEPTAADVALVDRITATLQQDTSLTGMVVDVTVEEAVVTLTGRVRQESDKYKIEQMVRRIPGVKRVDNKLIIQYVKPKYIQVPRDKMIGGPGSSGK